MLAPNTPDLGEIIAREMEAKGLTCKSLASKIYEKLGYNLVGSATSYISIVRTGNLYGTSSAKAREKPENIERLAILLYAIGFDAESELIKTIRKEDHRFEYPPKNGISYKEIRRGS